MSDADIEIVNTATETEEVFFENMNASEHIENDAAKKDAAVETEIAESVESAPFALSAKADAESSAMEAVDIDSFMETTSNVPPPEDSIFAEPLQLGEPRTDNAAHKEIKPIDFDVVSAPNFLFLDEERKESSFGSSPEDEAVHGDVLPLAEKSKSAAAASDPDGAEDI